jgi:tetratricopeptide (TPR) repeat protein
MGKHLDRAEILLDLDKYDLAEKELRQEIVENPDSDLAHGSLARCLINQRKLGADTLQIVEYALSLNPENDWLHYLLAVYWHMSGDFNRAQTAIGVSIELDPNSPLYFDTLARILFDRGNDNFKTHSRRVLALIFIFSRGVLWPISWGISATFKSYWLRSYLQPVFAPLEKSLSLDPEYLSALNLQTQLLINTNRSHRALDSSLYALRIDPNDGTAHRLHAQTLLRLGKYTPARDHFQSSLSIDPSSTESKAGLLEAVRSQYWLYPWISITNRRGILVIIGVFTIDVALGISTIWFKNEGMFALFSCLIFIPAICLGFGSKSIFNLFLQFHPTNKIPIKRSISLWETIFGNYIASLIIAIISSIYLFTCFIFISDHKLFQPIATTNLGIITVTIGVIAGIFISTLTFLPVFGRYGSRSLSLIYPLLLSQVGLFTIALHLSTNQIGSFGKIFFWLVFLSPAVAIYSSKSDRK